MGILKIRLNNKKQKQSPETSANSHAENNLNYDSDELDVAEVGCEVALLGGQICDIPYELYTLPDLKEILSLETWNHCLTEDERFSLTAFVPDLDQEMFWLTAKELLSGDNMFFGSPMDKLFQRLKGGLYSPSVVHFMEAMQLLQKRKFCHTLRSYHETMIKRFEDMRRSWRDLQLSIAAQERIKIWKRKQQKPVVLVDLNAFPTDEDVSTNSFNVNELNRQEFSGTLPSLSLNKNMKAKGVLKIRPVNMSFVENQMVQPSVTDTFEVCRRPPKGVLKIKGKSDHLSKAETPKSYDLLQSPISRIAPPQFATWWNLDNKINGLPYQHQFREYHSGENPRPNFDPSSSIPSRSSIESYSFPLKSHDRRGNAEIYKAKPETMYIGGAILHTRLESRLHGDQVIEGEKASDNYAISDAQRDNPVFPFMYKRKKPFAKVDSNKKLAMNVCLEENISGSDSNVPQKSGGLRIRLKPLNDCNAHYKQGLLNELQLGPSSTRGI